MDSNMLLILIYILMMVQILPATKKLLVKGRNSPQIRIIGGEDASEQFPFAVLLVSRLRKQRPLCGGCLISNRHVLTAAHCLQTPKKISYEPPHNILLMMGARDVITKQQTGAVAVRMAKQFHIHPEFNQPSYCNNDIAIVEMNEQVEYSQTISAICLGLPGMDEPGVLTTIVGWGKTAHKNESPVLQSVDIPIHHPQNCQKIYNKNFLSDKMICAGYPTGGKDACQGDSGGPMVVEVDNRMVLVGVVSYGDGCAKPKAFGVYTKVTQYSSWIISIAKDVCLAS